MVDKAETAKHNVKQVNGTEYGEPKQHNHVKSNHQRDVYMVSQTDSKVCLSLTHQSKQIKVTLTFPERSDQKAEQEFISRLKAVYLEKVKNGSMQKEDLALQSPTTKQQSSESTQNDFMGT